VVELSVDEQTVAIGELIEKYSNELIGPVLLTITRARIRVRRRNGS
jgi:hypothetical protein